MARERRSTSGIIGRLAAVIGSVLLIHIVARLLFWMGMFVKFPRRPAEAYFDMSSNQWVVPDSGPTFWNMAEETAYYGWVGLVGIHLLAVLALLVAILVLAAAQAFIRWIMFKDNRTVIVCANQQCRCAEHKDKVFRTDLGYWNDTTAEQDAESRSTTNMMLTMATGIAVGSIIGSN